MNTDPITRPTRTIAPKRPMYRKKLSIFTSATTPYGPSRNALMPPTDMLATAYRKRPNKMYLSDCSAISPHRGIRQLRRNHFLPHTHKYSEIVPTGQSQLQKLFRSSHDIPMKEIKRKTPAG